MIDVFAICLKNILPSAVNNVLNEIPDAKLIASLIGLTSCPSFGDLVRPTPPEVIVTLIAQECSTNTSDFLPDEGDKEGFEHCKRIYFNGDFEPDSGDIIKAFRSSLQTLTLIG